MTDVSNGSGSGEGASELCYLLKIVGAHSKKSSVFF